MVSYTSRENCLTDRNLSGTGLLSEGEKDAPVELTFGIGEAFILSSSRHEAMKLKPLKSS